MTDFLDTLFRIGVGATFLLFVIVIVWFGAKWFFFGVLILALLFVCWGAGMMVTEWIKLIVEGR